MGIGLDDVKLFFELYQRGFFKKIHSIIEMGSIDLRVKQKDFEDLIHAVGITGYDAKNFELWNCCSTKPLYELLGVEEYSCIDINGNYGALQLDLNKPLEDTTLYNRYDMVTDFGTCEHVFNISEAYRTMHRLLKPSGVMITSQTVFNNVGYYLFDYPFFEGLALMNNYKVLFSSYNIVFDSVNDGDIKISVPVSSILLKSLNYTMIKSVGIIYVLQKQSDSDFRFAYQDFSKVLSYSSDKQRVYGYLIQFMPGNPPGRVYLPVIDENSDEIKTMDLMRIFYKKISNKLCYPK